MKYKNISYTEATYYGVTFNPGEIKDVPGYINNPHFIRVEDVQNTSVSNASTIDTRTKSPSNVAQNKIKSTTKGGTK